MALPNENQPWPPKADSARYERMRHTSTWYGGDPQRLAALYRPLRPQGQTQQHRPGVVGFVRDWFWGTQDAAEPENKLHLPVAQGLATRSSELLFAQAPKFVVLPQEFDANGEVTEAHKAEVKRTQERLDTILEACGMESLLLAAAETQAALGAVALRIGYAPGMTMPTITRVDADAMVVQWAFGQLESVMFWRVVSRDDQTWWRHVEVHTRGLVEHGLYKGHADNLGKAQPLSAHPDTKHLEELTGGTGVVIVPQQQLLAQAIPNALPDALDRTNLTGRSDFTPGVLGLFDSIDRAYTSMMRDIEDGESRLLIAESLLEDLGAGRGVRFNQDQHVFTRVNMPPSDNEGKMPIEQVQFDIRVEQHIQALDWLVREAYHESGYNTDAETGDGGQPMTATEYQGRAKRDLNTRAKKARYWERHVRELLTALLVVDAEVFRSGVRPLPVTMELAQPVAPSERAQAEVVELWGRAKAASLRTKVAALHPDWTPEQVDAEVTAIEDAGRLADPAATLGPAVAGAPLGQQAEQQQPAGV